MGFLSNLFRGNPQIQSPAASSGVNVNSSVLGKPIALIYGTTKVAGNLILYGNFQSHTQQNNSGGGGGGKGGLFGAPSGGSSSSTTTYNAAFAFGLGEGPIQGIGTVWSGLNQNSLGGWGFSLFLGGYPQSPWGTTVSWSVTDANGVTTSGTSSPLNYNGVAYVAAPNFNLGTSTSIPNLQYEVQGILANSVPGFVDADPSQVMTDFLTNVHYGLGFPSAQIGSLTNWKNYCIANGLLVSPYYSTQRTGTDMIDELMLATNSEMFFSSGVIQVTPRGDQAITANGVTFNPNLTPIYSIGDNDYMQLPQQSAGGGTGGGNGPVLLTRKRKSDTINSVKVEYLDRSNNYNPAVAYAENQAEIDGYGKRTNGSKQLHLFCSAAAANLSAHLQLRKEMITNTYTFDLDMRYILLDPMDIIEINDSNLGLSNLLVRITQIQENDDGTLSFLCEDLNLGVGGAPAYSFGQQGGQKSVNFNAPPGNLNPPLIFEPTDQLAGGLFIWAAVSGDQTAVAGWGGCNVWASYDNVNYALITSITNPARMGFSTAAFPTVGINPTGQTIDQTSTLAVDLTESQGTLTSGTVLDATSLNTRCYIGPANGVGGEVVSFETATLTATYKYSLTYLVRGAYGTTGNALALRAPGATFARLDTGIGAVAYSQSRIGTTVYLKFQSFNRYGGGLVALSSCTAYPYMILGTALTSALPNVTNFRSSYNNQTGFTSLDWDFITDFRNGIQYEVRVGPTTWEGAFTLGVVSHPPFTVPGTGTYFIKARCQPVPNLIVYSAIASQAIISGGVITQNVIQTIDIAAANFPGKFTGNIHYNAGLNALESDGTVDVVGGMYYPNDAALNVGYTANVSVSIKFQCTGSPLGSNVLTISNLLTVADLLGTASAGYVIGYPMISTSNGATSSDLYLVTDLYQPDDLYSASFLEYTPWQRFTPGVYQAQYLNFAFFLQSIDPTTAAVVLAFAVTSTIPARVDQYSTTTSAAGTVTVTFSPAAFNGGSGAGNTPTCQATIVNATAGDQVRITSKTVSSLLVDVVNGGVRVVRTVELVVEGF